MAIEVRQTRSYIREMVAHYSRKHHSQAITSVNRITEKHVLIVDDDPEMREMLVEYLESQNFRVTAVADGGAMACVLDHRPVDLIILDMQLADEEGLDVMRRLGTP